jgi:hypothetical protein
LALSPNARRGAASRPQLGRAAGTWLGLGHSNVCSDGGDAFWACVPHSADAAERPVPIGVSRIAGSAGTTPEFPQLQQCTASQASLPLRLALRRGSRPLTARPHRTPGRQARWPDRASPPERTRCRPPRASSRVHQFPRALCRQRSGGGTAGSATGARRCCRAARTASSETISAGFVTPLVGWLGWSLPPGGSVTAVSRSGHGRVKGLKAG